MPRPKEPILSRDLIRDQALAIIDEGGLEALTMRRLADRFSVQAASLYTHFPNKEAVLNAVAERLAKRIDPTGFTDNWQAGLRTWANSYYEAIHWHPNAAPVVAAGTGGQNLEVAVAEQIVDGLRSHGWPPADAAMATTAVKLLVLGAAAATAAGSDVDTFDRAAFTYALDCLIAGLESVQATFGVTKRRTRSSSSAAAATGRTTAAKRAQRLA